MTSLCVQTRCLLSQFSGRQTQEQDTWYGSNTGVTAFLGLIYSILPSVYGLYVIEVVQTIVSAIDCCFWFGNFVSLAAQYLNVLKVLCWVWQRGPARCCELLTSRRSDALRCYRVDRTVLLRIPCLHAAKVFSLDFYHYHVGMAFSFSFS